MRSLALAMLFALCACSDSDRTCVHNGTQYSVGDVFPAGDGCNSCTCTASGVTCTTVACSDAGIDASPLSCAASGGCPEGPACGVICCKHGERCTNGTCMCATHPSCSTGDTCEAPGPVGGDRCGTVCCGRSGPCPQ